MPTPSFGTRVPWREIDTGLSAGSGGDLGLGAEAEIELDRGENRGVGRQGAS